MIIAYVLAVAMLIAIPIKRRKMLKTSGKCLMAFPKKEGFRNVSIIVFALALITLVYFFNYKFYVNIALCGCGVIGTYIAAKEIAFSDLYGIYENGLCASGVYIPYDQITNIIDVDNIAGVTTTLHVYRNKKMDSLSFDSEQQKNIILKKLTELKVGKA